MIAGPELVAVLAENICRLGNLGWQHVGMDLPYTLGEELTDCRQNGRRNGRLNEKLVYEKLYRFNVQAFEGRYEEEHVMDEIPPMPDMAKFSIPLAEYTMDTVWNYGVRRQILKPAHYRFVKALDFYLYQVSEDATDGTELYKGLEDLRAALCRFITANQPEYNLFPWGEVKMQEDAE